MHLSRQIQCYELSQSATTFIAEQQRCSLQRICLSESIRLYQLANSFSIGFLLFDILSLLREPMLGAAGLHSSLSTSGAIQHIYQHTLCWRCVCHLGHTSSPFRAVVHITTFRSKYAASIIGSSDLLDWDTVVLPERSLTTLRLSGTRFCRTMGLPMTLEMRP